MFATLLLPCTSAHPPRAASRRRMALQHEVSLTAHAFNSGTGTLNKVCHKREAHASAQAPGPCHGQNWKRSVVSVPSWAVRSKRGQQTCKRPPYKNPGRAQPGASSRHLMLLH